VIIQVINAISLFKVTEIYIKGHNNGMNITIFTSGKKINKSGNSRRGTTDNKHVELHQTLELEPFFVL
jgi:hypothetical protein